MLAKIDNLRISAEHKQFLSEYVKYFQQNQIPYTDYRLHTIDFDIESLHLIVGEELHLFDYVLENDKNPELLDLINAAAKVELHSLGTLIMAIYARSVSSISPCDLIKSLRESA